MHNEVRTCAEILPELPHNVVVVLSVISGARKKKNEPCIKQENLGTIWKRLQCCKLFSSETTTFT